jgi:polar amino acid transport system substrate-binding protein
MRAVRRLCAIALMLVCVPAGALLAADEAPPHTLHVATRVIPPLVIRDGNALTGFSIDLWNDIAAQLGTRTEFEVEPDVPALLDTVAAHKADLGIAAISITAERDRKFDFSQPMLASGLQILVRGSGEGSAANPLFDLLRLLTSPVLAVWLGIALLLIVIPAHILWFVERRHQNGITDDRYFPGIFQALWWAGSTLAT